MPLSVCLFKIEYTTVSFHTIIIGLLFLAKVEAKSEESTWFVLTSSKQFIDSNKNR